jgi:hypothetical protein
MSSDCQVPGETQRDATRPPRDAAPAHSMPVNGSPGRPPSRWRSDRVSTASPSHARRSGCHLSLCNDALPCRADRIGCEVEDRCDLFIGQHRRISRLRPASSHLPGHERGVDRSAGAGVLAKYSYSPNHHLVRHKYRTNGLAADRRRLRLLLHLSGICTELTNSMHLHLCTSEEIKNL